MALLRKLAGSKHHTENDELKSIIDNINNVLNTKRGYGYFLQDFGLSDYSHLSSREDIAKMIIHEIGENIERFEPRLVLLKIMVIKNDDFLRLSFQIDCLVRHHPHSLKVYLDPILKRYQVKL